MTLRVRLCRPVPSPVLQPQRQPAPDEPIVHENANVRERRKISPAIAPRVAPRLLIPVLFVLLLLSLSCASAVRLPEYSAFANAHSSSLGFQNFAEIYGRIQAKVKGRTARSGFNLLIDPGKQAYMEIIGPEQQMLFAFSLNSDQFVLLWAQERTYLKAPATPQSLKIVTGVSALADDLLMILSGNGLNFPEWSLRSPAKQGWNLVRNPYQAEVTLRENVSRIRIASDRGERWSVRYENYALENNRSLPTEIRVDIPDEKLEIRLRIDRYVPRSESPSADLFQVDLPAGASETSLSEAYSGTPILLSR